MLNPYFNLFKVKYEILTNLLRESKDIQIGLKDNIDVFIDLEPILIKLANTYINDYIKSGDKSIVYEFISNIVNLAAHYRWFFTKHKLTSRIYLCMPSITTKEFKNTAYHSDYRKYFTFKFLSDVNNEPLTGLICNSIDYIKLIVEYIQGVYFIESGPIENSVIPYVINKYNDDNSINFLVTNSSYNFQYVNHNCNIIVPRKDDSVLLTKRNIIDFIADIHDCNGNYTINSNMVPFILSITGNKYRNIYNIKRMQMKSTFKLIQKALNANLISNNITNIYMLSQTMIPSVRDQLILNYNLTDIESQYNRLNKKDLFSIYDQLKDKLDNVSLKKINDKLFIKDPLMLVEITTIPYKGNVKF